MKENQVENSKNKTCYDNIYHNKFKSYLIK